MDMPSYMLKKSDMYSAPVLWCFAIGVDGEAGRCHGKVGQDVILYDRKKNDKRTVARLANQTRNPGAAAPGTASPVDVEVEEPSDSPVAVLVEETDAVSSAASTVRVPANVSTKGVVFSGGNMSHKDFKIVTTGDVLVIQLV